MFQGFVPRERNVPTRFRAINNFEGVGVGKFLDSVRRGLGGVIVRDDDGVGEQSVRALADQCGQQLPEQNWPLKCADANGDVFGFHVNSDG
jgi:hypothetical protein